MRPAARARLRVAPAQGREQRDPFGEQPLLPEPLHCRVLAAGAFAPAPGPTASCRCARVRPPGHRVAQRELPVRVEPGQPQPARPRERQRLRAADRYGHGPRPAGRGAGRRARGSRARWPRPATGEAVRPGRGRCRGVRRRSAEPSRAGGREQQSSAAAPPPWAEADARPPAPARARAPAPGGQQPRSVPDGLHGRRVQQRRHAAARRRAPLGAQQRGGDELSPARARSTAGCVPDPWTGEPCAPPASVGAAGASVAGAVCDASLMPLRLSFPVHPALSAHRAPRSRRRPGAAPHACAARASQRHRLAVAPGRVRSEAAVAALAEHRDRAAARHRREPPQGRGRCTRGDGQRRTRPSASRQSAPATSALARYRRTGTTSQHGGPAVQPRVVAQRGAVRGERVGDAAARGTRPAARRRVPLAQRGAQRTRSRVVGQLARRAPRPPAARLFGAPPAGAVGEQQRGRPDACPYSQMRRAVSRPSSVSRWASTSHWSRTCSACSSAEQLRPRPR